MTTLPEGWQPIETAPKDGTIIEVSYDLELKERCLAKWSDDRHCMLGRRAGSFPVGWATTEECPCEKDLPLDTPLIWKTY